MLLCRRPHAGLRPLLFGPLPYRLVAALDQVDTRVGSYASGLRLRLAFCPCFVTCFLRAGEGSHRGSIHNSAGAGSQPPLGNDDCIRLPRSALVHPAICEGPPPNRQFGFQQMRHKVASAKEQQAGSHGRLQVLSTRTMGDAHCVGGRQDTLSFLTLSFVSIQVRIGCLGFVPRQQHLFLEPKHCIRTAPELSVPTGHSYCCSLCPGIGGSLGPCLLLLRVAPAILFPSGIFVC